MFRPTARAAFAAAALVSLFAADASAADAVSPHAFRKLVERTRGALVRLASPPGGTAVLIGVRGELLAPEHLVRGDVIRVEVAGTERQARVLERDRRLGVALLALDPGDYAAAAVGSSASLARGSFLLGLWFDGRGRLKAEPGRFDRAARDPGRLRTDVAGPAGSALFNARGELVAVHVGRRPSALAIDEVRARFAPARTR